MVWVGICSEWFLVSGTVWPCGVLTCRIQSRAHMNEPLSERNGRNEISSSLQLLPFAPVSCPLAPSLMPISFGIRARQVLCSKPGSATQQSEHKHHITSLKPSVSSALACSTVFTELLSTWDDAWTGYLLTNSGFYLGWAVFLFWGLTSTPEALCLDLNCRLTWANCDWVWLPCTSPAGPEVLIPVTSPSMPSPLCSSPFLVSTCLLKVAFLLSDQWQYLYAPNFYGLNRFCCLAPSLFALHSLTQAPIHTPKHCHESMPTRYHALDVPCTSVMRLQVAKCVVYTCFAMLRK